MRPFPAHRRRAGLRQPGRGHRRLQALQLPDAGGRAAGWHVHRLQLRLPERRLRAGSPLMLGEPLLSLIEQTIKGLRYGSVHLVIHEGKLVRIERVDRIRIATDSCHPTPPENPEGISNS